MDNVKSPRYIYEKLGFLGLFWWTHSRELERAKSEACNLELSAYLARIVQWNGHALHLLYSLLCNEIHALLHALLNFMPINLSKLA